MTKGNTKDEWLNVIEQAEQGVPSTFTKYEAPELGTQGFAKSIDHTLLKLEATESQIDQLCEEAKKHEFKVNLPIIFSSSFAIGKMLLLRNLLENTIRPRERYSFITKKK